MEFAEGGSLYSGNVTHLLCIAIQIVLLLMCIQTTNYQQPHLTEAYLPLYFVICAFALIVKCS